MYSYAKRVKMKYLKHFYKDGSQPRGHWLETPLEQFLLKIKAVKSGLWNRNMTGKIPTWWERSRLRNRKTAGKNSGAWNI
jgi:hypothetical protein